MKVELLAIVGPRCSGRTTLARMYAKMFMAANKSVLIRCRYPSAIRHAMQISTGCRVLSEDDMVADGTDAVIYDGYLPSELTSGDLRVIALPALR